MKVGRLDASMRESLDIDPLLREFLEVRRGLTSQEIDQLLIEWNGRGSLTDFLSGKSLIDRTTAKMLALRRRATWDRESETICSTDARNQASQPQRCKHYGTAPDTAPLPQTAQPQSVASDAARTVRSYPTYRTPPTPTDGKPDPTRAPAPENGSWAVPEEEQ